MKQKYQDNFYGETRRRLELDRFVLTETIYPSHLIVPGHAHAKAYFCFVLQGSFTEQYEKRSRLCRPASVIFHPPGESHSDQFDKTPGKCFNFEVEKDWLEHLRDHSIRLDSPLEFHGGKPAQIFTRLYRELCYFDEVSPLAVESLSLEMAVNVARAAKSNRCGRPPAWLRSVKDLLNDKVSEQLSLPSIAQTINIHPVHLARTFRTFYGASIGEYLRNLKIEHGSRALASSDKPISTIAYELGFSSQSHFSTVFKRLTGSSPAQYRALFGKEKSFPKKSDTL